MKYRRGIHLERVTTKVVFGKPETVCQKLGRHNSYVERTHLTSRHMNGRLIRKTISYSKRVEMLEASSAWEDMVYNLVRPLKTLRLEAGANEHPKKWILRTPSMVTALTDHIWTVEELLTTRISPLLLQQH